MIAIKRFRDFLNRQYHNYRMLLVLSSGDTFLTNLTANYNSIYTIGLGASPVILGLIKSVSSAVNVFISLPVGWFSDRYNLKSVMGIGMAIQALMIVFYAFAQNWNWILLAMILSPFTQALMMRSQTIMISKDLRDEERAQGFGLRQAISLIIGILAPIPAALFVRYFGGLTVEGIRPLFFIRLIGVIILYIYIFLKLVDVPPGPRTKNKSFLKDFHEVLKDGKGLKAWIAVSCITSIINGIMMPFIFLYTVEVKGADALTLGLLSTVEALSSIIFMIPMSKIADNRGRKVGFLVTRPARFVWFLTAVFAPNSYWLIVAWFFKGISVSNKAYHTWNLELVPPDKRGRWLGITNTISSIFQIPAPIIGGFLYRKVNPSLIFLVPLALDAFIRVPILVTLVPETLKKTRTPN